MHRTSFSFRRFEREIRARTSIFLSETHIFIRCELPLVAETIDS